MNIRLPTPEESYKSTLLKLNIPLPKSIYTVTFGKEIITSSCCKICLGTSIVSYGDESKGPCSNCTNGIASYFETSNEFVSKKHANICVWSHPFSNKTILGKINVSQKLAEAQVFPKTATIEFVQLVHPETFFIPEISEIGTLEPNFFGDRIFLDEDTANFCCEFLNLNLKSKGEFSDELIRKPYSFFL